MTRPKQDPGTFRGAFNLELEVDHAPEDVAVKDEGIPGRLFQFVRGFI
jgi:hypothetical protein